jgi:hypothetical protein
VIVDCPSCGTHYRHSAAVQGALQAHCSRCDERFPLRPRRRGYVLVPPISLNVPVAVGVAAVASAVGSGLSSEMPAATHGTPAGIPDLAASLLDDRPGLGDDLSGLPDNLDLPPTPVTEPSGVTFSHELAGTSAGSVVSAVSAASAASAVSGLAAASAHFRRSVREAPAVMFLATAGAGMAYYGSSMTGNVALSTAVGGVIGLLAGWLVVRWMARQ